MSLSTRAKHHHGRRFLSAAAAAMVTASGITTASATIINIDGGVWDYGSDSNTVWSHYYHNGVRHGSTAVGTFSSDSGCVNKNLWSHSSAPRKLFGNESYYRHC